MIDRRSLVLTFVAGIVLPASAAEYYVAPDGSDEKAGTVDAPWRTIQKAADAMGPGDTCFVRAGTYREVVRPKRSGAKDKPILFAAYPGETVVLSGAKPIRADWTVHKGRIYKARVDEAFDQLFLDGRMMIQARWPNMRFEQRFDKSVWAELGKGSSYGVVVDPNLPATGIDWTGAVATLNVGQWQTWRRTVGGHKAGGDRFTYPRDLTKRMEHRKPYHWETMSYYYVAGKLEALDAPTEWHLDRDAKTLYLWAPDGKSPAERTVEAKVRDYAFDAAGRQYIELRGFHFFGASLRLVKCDHCIVDNCHLRFATCVHGFDPAPPTLIDGEDNAMRNCSVVFSDGEAVTMKGANNTLENCLLHDCNFNGLINGLGVNMGASATSVIRRCTVFDMGSSEGIVVPRVGPSEVAYNHVHHVGYVQSDGGLIQSGGLRLAGTEIHHNWVHDHTAFHWGRTGIRGDDLTRGLSVHHNVAWNCAEKGIVVKGDRNRVYHNTCFDNAERDILATSRPEPFKPWAPSQHPHLLKQQNANTHIANNVAEVILGTFRHEKPQAPPLGKMENNYRGADPKLADPAKRDFRPASGSPLIDAGKAIGGVNDGYKGKAPDIGAYEAGAERWVPGHRNGLWLLRGPLPKPGAPMQVRVLLAMPPLEPVAVRVFAGAGGLGISPASLTFTPENWTTPRLVYVQGRPDLLRIRFTIERLGLDQTVDMRAVDTVWGLRLPFRTIP